MDYTITKEQITELWTKYPTAEFRESLKQMFPDAFKKELETNRWYQIKVGDLSTHVVFTDPIKKIGYGFGFEDIWLDKLEVTCSDSAIIPAIIQDVKFILTEEAKKRGLIDGATVDSSNLPSSVRKENVLGKGFYQDGKPRNLGYGYYADCDALEYSDNIIYHKGIWATTIEAPKPQPNEYTMQQLEEIIGSKIKIVN